MLSLKINFNFFLIFSDIETYRNNNGEERKLEQYSNVQRKKFKISYLLFKQYNV